MKKEILVVVDMQVDFVTGSLANEQAKQIVPAVAKKIEEYEAKDHAQILVTMDTHTADYLNTREGRFLPVEHCMEHTEGWEIVPQLRGLLSGKKTFQKSTFGSEALAEYLKELAKEEELEILFVGVCTDICVVSNALLVKAALPETELCVDASCCAGVSIESHEAALLTMQSCQIRILR